MGFSENQKCEVHDLVSPVPLNAAAAAFKVNNPAHPASSRFYPNPFSKGSADTSVACAAPVDVMPPQIPLMTDPDVESDLRVPNVPRIAAATTTRRGPNLVYWLRGLPFQTQRSDVEFFLSGIDYSKLDIGVLENGECSGNAFVELKWSKHQAELEALHNSFIPVKAHAALAAEVRPKPRFVEVMPSNPAKRLEQLEHDRCLSRDATRRQRRLQNGTDNPDEEGFSAHYAASFRDGAFPAFVSMSNNSSQFSNLSTSGSIPMQLPPPPPPPQPQQALQPQAPTCYVPYGVPVASSSLPTHFMPTFPNYPTHPSPPAMVSFAPQVVGDVAAGAAPQTYSLSYQYVGAMQPTPCFGHTIAFQAQPQSLPTMMLASPYGAAPFALLPSYS